METYNSTRKGIILGMIIIFISIISILIVVGIATKTTADNYDEAVKYVGTTIVVNNDTVEITGYSLITDEYSLLNGKTVSYEYVLKKSRK